jgi:hypothetical protein
VYTGRGADPSEVGGAFPQTAVTLTVTGHYSSTLLNFAAHSPEDADETEKCGYFKVAGPEMAV